MKADTKAVTREARFAYTGGLQKPDEHGFYTLCVLVPKTDKETETDLRAKAKLAADSSAALFGGKVPPNLKMPLRDGDIEKDDPDFKGHWFFNCKTKQRPGIVDVNRQPILDPSEVYSGCYGRVSVVFYAYNKEGNKGVGVGLQNVQKTREGEPMGGRSTAEADFADFLA